MCEIDARQRRNPATHTPPTGAAGGTRRGSVKRLCIASDLGILKKLEPLTKSLVADAEICACILSLLSYVTSKNIPRP